MSTIVGRIGLTKTDGVRLVRRSFSGGGGAQAKWNELYEQYYERHFVTGNDEMMHIFKEHSDYKNSNALVVHRFRKS